MSDRILTNEKLLEYIIDGKKLYIPSEIKGIKVIQDIDEAKEAVLNNQTITRFEFGDSLEPFVHSGEYLILHPIKDINNLKVEDVVLCEVNGYLMTHMIVDIDVSNDKGKEVKQYLIGNGDKSYIYGYATNIYALCTPFGLNLEEREFVEFK